VISQALKLLLLDNLSQSLIQGVIFDKEKVLHKLLQNFLESQLVDLCVGPKPACLHPNLLESLLPVGHVVKLVLG
jgi:hypothetical protein